MGNVVRRPYKRLKSPRLKKYSALMSSSQAFKTSHDIRFHPSKTAPFISQRGRFVAVSHVRSLINSPCLSFHVLRQSGREVDHLFVASRLRAAPRHAIHGVG